MWLHLIDGCFLFICLRQRSQNQITGACLFVCVVGPAFDWTSPAFVMSRASQAARSDGRLAQKRNRASIPGGSDCVDTICADICSIPTSCSLCLLRTCERVHCCLRFSLCSSSDIGGGRSFTMLLPRSLISESTARVCRFWRLSFLLAPTLGRTVERVSFSCPQDDPASAFSILFILSTLSVT